MRRFKFLADPKGIETCIYTHIYISIFTCECVTNAQHISALKFAKPVFCLIVNPYPSPNFIQFNLVSGLLSSCFIPIFGSIWWVTLRQSNGKSTVNGAFFCLANPWTGWGMANCYVWLPEGKFLAARKRYHNISTYNVSLFGWDLTFPFFCKLLCILKVVTWCDMSKIWKIQSIATPKR